MLPCLGGIVARNYSDDSSSDDELRSTKPIVALTATLDGPRQSAAQHGFPKAARRALPTNNHTTTNKASTTPTTTNSNNSSSAAGGVSKSKGVHFDPSIKGPLTTTRPTPAASRSAAATSTAERPLSDEELSLMGWWVSDPVRRMDGAVETTMTPPSSSANDMEVIVPESGSQEWLSRRSTLMPMDKRLSTLVRCMQSSAPQHQRSFLAISRALLRSPKSNAGERLRKLFLIDGADSAMRWFRLFRIIEESSTGAYRHRGAITTPMPVVTEEALGLVGDLLRPYMTSPSGASFQSDLVSAEPMRAEHVAAQLVEVLNGEGKEDKPITAEALLMPPCPTFEEIGSLFTTTSSGDKDKSSSSERLEFEASSGAEKALMAGINLEEPITNTTIEAFTTAYYNEDNDGSSSNAVAASLASSPPVHKVVLALTHLAAPELILHLLTESFELSRSTSRSAVSIVDNNAQSPLSIAALLRFALFLCEHHPLASHRFVLAELLPRTSSSNTSTNTSSSQPPTSSTSAPRSTTLRLLDNLSGMFVEDYERLLMEEDPTTSNIPLGSLLDVMFLTGRLVGYLIPSAVATEQLSLQDTNNATDVLRMVAALSTSLLRKATDVIVMCVGLLGQLEGDLGLIGVADEVPATHTWLACWLTARTAVVHEALVEHERSARGGAAVDFASSSAASELLPLALRWTNRGSLILGSAVLQAHSGDENLEQQRNLGDVRLLSSAGEDVVGDPSGWMQSMVGAACGLLSAVTSSTSQSHNNTALEMYRRVAAVYLVAQYRKCKANTTSTLDIPSLLVAPLSATAKVSKDEAFSPLGKAMLAFVQNGLSTPSSPHRALTMSIAKDLVEELVARCEADGKKKIITTTNDDDDFDFSEDAMMKDANTATATTVAIKALAPLLVGIGKLVDSLLAPIARNINPVSTTTSTSSPVNSRKNALFALLGSMTPDASEALLGAIIMMETVSRSAYVYPLVQPLLPSITVSTMDAPLSIIALAAITVTQTESTQQAPLLMASIINRYFTTTTSSFGDEVGTKRDQQQSSSHNNNLPKPKIGAFVLKMDELLSSSSEYYDPTSLFGFRRPAIDIGAVDLQQIEEFGDNQAAFGEREIETVMGTKEAEDAAMLLVWRVIVSSLVWNVRSGGGDESCGTDDDGSNYLSTILEVLVDVEGLFSEVLMWRLQAAASGVQFPPPPPQVPNMIPYKAAFECVLGNLSRQGIDSRSRPLWPLPSFPTSDPFVRFHPIEVVSDLLLSVIGTPVVAPQNSLTPTTGGGWGMVEKELGSLTDSLGFQSIPPSVIRALLGSLVSATPLTTTTSMPSSSLACGIPPPPPSTLVTLLKLICTDTFLASYGALPLHQQRPSSSSSSTSTQHVPLIAADLLMSHAASQGQQVGGEGGGGVSLLPSWSEHMVITMVEEFGAVALRHHQALLTSSTSIHPLHAIAHLIRWASACTLQRRQQFTPDVCVSLDIVADIVHELGLEPYHLLP